MSQPSKPNDAAEPPPPYDQQGYTSGYQYGYQAPSAPPPPGAYGYPTAPVAAPATSGYVYGSVAPGAPAYAGQPPGMYAGQSGVPTTTTTYYQMQAPPLQREGYHDGIHNSDSHSDYDGEAAEFHEGFTDKHIRHGFVKKVYAILSVQIVITAALMCVFIFVESVRDYVRHQSWVFITAMCVLFVLIIVLACCDHVRRQFPLNIILLLLFTVVEGVMLGAVSAFYDTTTVLMAAGIVAVLVLALSLFALQTKWDFTVCAAGLFVFLVCLLIFGLLCIIIRSRYTDIVYASLGALLFSFYLIFDTQMMLGGKHKYALSPEEYIFAALNLYLDIVNIFLFVLSIVGLARG